MESTLLAGLVIAILTGGLLLWTAFAERQRRGLRAHLADVVAGVAGGVAPLPRAPILRVARPFGTRRVLPFWAMRRLSKVAPSSAVWVNPTELVAAAGGGVALVLFVGVFFSADIAVLIPLTLVAALALPAVWLQMAKSKFDAAFLQQFPDALDLMVRAVVAGLPVVDAMTNVGQEIANPVGLEFRRMLDDMTIGAELEAALVRADGRIRITEFSFFRASAVLQRQTGGNLAETMRNLSRTIRRRNEMRLKIRAVTSEGRTSARLLGALPIMMGGGIYLLDPRYIGMLFTDPRGNKLLLAAALAMTMGVATLYALIKRVMR